MAKRRVRLGPIDDPEAVGRRIREARERANLTLRELAFPGCTAAYISTLEHGRRSPSLQLLEELAKRLDVSAHYLATGHHQSRSFDDLRVAADVALALDEIDEAERQYLDILARQPESAIKCHALAGLAEIAERRGDPNEALVRLQEAERMLQPSFDAAPRVLEQLGRLYANRSQYDESIAVLTRALESTRANGDRASQLRLAVVLANALSDSGNSARAHGVLADVLPILDDVAGDPISRARVYWTQARVHTAEGRFDLAADYARRALSTIQQTDDELYAARAHHLLAYIELERGDAQAALDWLDRGEPLIERRGDSFERAKFALERARALIGLDRLGEAKERALDAASALTGAAKGDAGRSYAVLADIFRRLGDEERALSMYETAIEALSDHPSPHLIHAYREKAALLEAQGRATDALETLKQAVDVQEQLSKSGRGQF